MSTTNTIINKRTGFFTEGASYITREGGALVAPSGDMGTVADKWTIGTWIKRQDRASSTDTIFSLRNIPLGLGNEILFQNWLSTNDLRWGVRNSAGGAQNIWEIVDLPAYDLNADWEFFVFTYDYNGGTAQWSTYYNGAALDETPGSGVGDPYLDHATVGNPLQTDVDKYISVGNFITNDPPGFDGHIFNWAMWDRVLSAAEVSVLYNGGSGWEPDYRKNYLDYSNEGLHFYYNFDDEANRGKNLGSLVSRDLEDDEQGKATYTVDDLPGTNNPTIYMEDNMSFMLNPGSKSNAHYIAGDDTLSTVFPSDFNTLSFSLWYKKMPGITPAGFDSVMGSTTNWSNWTDGFGLYWTNAGTNMRFWINSYNVAANYVNGTLLGTDWHNIVGVYDGPNTTLSLYDQGQLIGQNTSALSANVLRTGAQNFYLARLGNLNMSSATYGSGFYNEAVLFDTVLSAAEIKSLYNMGVPGSPSGMSPRLWWRMEESVGDSDDPFGPPVVEDQSGNDFDGTPTRAGTSTGNGSFDMNLSEHRPTFQSVSAEFVASSDYIETKSISPYLGGFSADWTAACWFKPTATPAASDECVIIETTDPSDESVFQWYIDDADDLHIKLWDNAGTLFKHFSVAHEGNNVWQYVVAVYTDSGDVLTVYSGTDGTEDTMSDITGSMTKTVDNAGTMSNEGPQTIRFGNNAAHDTNFPGLIYSLSLWDDDLTVSEVSELQQMRSFRSPVSGNYGSYTSNTDLNYHYDWRDQYFVGDNRAPNKTSPSIDTSVGDVWPPTNTDVPQLYGTAGG